MQTRSGPHPDQATAIKGPATTAEIAIGEGELEEVDDDLAFLGAVLIVSGWDSNIALRHVSADNSTDDHDDVPEPSGDDAPTCGGADVATEDVLPVFTPIATVRGVQERLAWLGWYDETPSGLLDAATQVALRAFQVATDLTPNGFPDGATRNSLVRRIGW